MISLRRLNRFSVGLCAIFALTLAGCENYTPSEDPLAEKPQPSIFGDGGIGNLFGNNDAPAGAVIGVNSFLWRASLETVSFMPISTADAFGGVIITDWYSPAESPRERFKLNVYILGRTLRADGVKVAVFRQLRDATGQWADSNVPTETGPKIEESILTKARILRHQTLTSQSQ